VRTNLELLPRVLSLAVLDPSTLILPALPSGVPYVSARARPRAYRLVGNPSSVNSGGPACLPRAADCTARTDRVVRL